MLPPSKRKVRNYLFITQCVMVVILCFAYLPRVLLGVGISIITFNGDFIRYMFFSFVIIILVILLSSNLFLKISILFFIRYYLPKSIKIFCEIILQNVINISIIVPEFKNSINTIPVTKNGPNGIYSSSIFFFFLYIIIPIATIADIKNAKSVISSIFLNPKNSPNRCHKFYITHSHCLFTCNYSSEVLP